jgi:hypothetical protein
MGFLTRCKRLFSFAFLLQNRNTFFSFFLKSFLILSEKQQGDLFKGPLKCRFQSIPLLRANIIVCVNKNY